MMHEQTGVERDEVEELELIDSPYPRPLSVRLDASFMRPAYRVQYERRLAGTIVLLVVFGIAWVVLVPPRFGFAYQFIVMFLPSKIMEWSRKGVPEDSFAPPDEEQDALARQLSRRSGRSAKVQIIHQGIGSCGVSLKLADEKTVVQMAEGLFDQLTPFQRFAFARSGILWDGPQIAITVVMGLAIISGAQFMGAAWYWTAISYLALPVIYALQWRESKMKHNRALARENLADAVAEVRAIRKELKHLSRYVKPVIAED
jgi:hypothetical protein